LLRYYILHRFCKAKLPALFAEFIEFRNGVMMLPDAPNVVAKKLVATFEFFLFFTMEIIFAAIGK
jgi:hypothetical protein